MSRDDVLQRLGTTAPANPPDVLAPRSSQWWRRRMLFGCLAVFASTLALVVGVRALSLEGPPRDADFAFVSDRDGDKDIYLINLENGLAFNLTDDDVWSDVPAWSPDGTQMAFEMDVDGSLDIGIINVECASLLALCAPEVRNLTEGGNFYMSSSPSAEEWPDWSPDGRQIAFKSNREGDDDIWVMDVACLDTPGSCWDTARRLTRGGANESTPDWSPDGEHILYISDRDYDNELYVMTSSGRNHRQLTFNSYDDNVAMWSPDGSQIVFTSYRNGNADLFLINADGSNERQLTFEIAQEGDPYWSPDGEYIAFESDREGNYQIYAIRPDGTGLKHLIFSEFLDWSSAWRPE